MILIDDRKGSAELVPFMPPETAKKIRLESADAMWFGSGPEGPCTYPCGLEYKSVTDAVQSMINKRFVGEQYPKMTRLYRRIYLLIEGEYKEGSDGRLLVPYWTKTGKEWTHHGWGVTYRQFDNWMNSLTETGKVIFKRSLSRAESASIVLNLYYMWGKEYELHRSIFAFDKSQQPALIEQPTVVRLMAAQIPGVGWKRSAEVAAAFSNPFAMVTATEAEWQQIAGIGKILSKKIVQTLRGNTTHSQNSAQTSPFVSSI